MEKKAYKSPYFLQMQICEQDVLNASGGEDSGFITEKEYDIFW
jgi:hypothetical protein